MTNVWAQAASEVKASSNNGSGSKWIKLANDGDSIVVIPRGAPSGIFEKNMPPSQYGAGGPTKFGAINMYDVGSKKMLVWESKPTAYGKICDAIGEMGPDYVYKIKRSGAAGSQKTEYAVLPMRPATAEELAAANACELHQLGGVPF
jgi:hypothetical protein